MNEIPASARMTALPCHPANAGIYNMKVSETDPRIREDDK